MTDDEATDVLSELRAALHDPGRRASVIRWLECWRKPGAAPPSRLVVAPDGGGFGVDDGPWRELGRRRVQRRLLLALARARGPLTARELLAAGWPGERMQPEAARNRLHVALCRLRRAGIGDLLEFDGRAWRLRDVVTVVEAPSVGA